MVNSKHNDKMRRVAIELVIDKGKSQAEVSKNLNIPRSTLNDMIKRYRIHNDYEKGQREVARRIVLNDEIKSNLLQLIQDNCTVTLGSMIEKLNLQVSQSTVWRWLKSLGISFKMTRPVPQSRNSIPVKLERGNYATWYTNLPIDRRYGKVIFIDESPFSLRLLRAHGRSLVGTTPNPVVQNNRGPNITMILAVSAISLVHCEAIIDGVNTAIFQQFLSKVHEVLGGEDFIIVMDNVKFHHSNLAFYDQYRCQVMFLHQVLAIPKPLR